MKQKLFMLVWDMDVNKGGISRVMLKRSAMLSDEYEVNILTLDYKNNYNDIEKKLIEMGRLSTKVRLLNIHDYYMKKFTQKSVTSEQVKYYKQQTKLYEDGYQIQDDEVTTKNCARYFINGLYVKYKKWNKSGELLFVDYFNESRHRIYKEEFRPNGLMYKRTYYDLNTNKPRQDLMFTEEGKCFLNKWYNPENGSIQNVFLVNPANNSVKKFSSNREFNTYWLEELSMFEIIKPIVICDGPGSTPVLLETNSDFIYKVCTIHSNHFSKPHTFGSPIKNNHIDMLENINNEDALVVLTESQKKHIVKQYGDHKNIHVIPHTVTHAVKNHGHKDPNLVSMVARYHPEKRIDSAILSFKKVVEKVPNARLEIYGDGPDRPRLEEVISENNLDKNVFLKGYIENAEEVFSKSLVSLLTSKYEGFSLVILESMVCKTPVISFDIPYGPKDIIVEGETGLLVEDNNIDIMAKRIIWLLENPFIAYNMGEDAHDYVIKKFSYEKHKSEWLELLGGLNQHIPLIENNACFHYEPTIV